ncbi:MAG: indole-3-glycerol phosphate synthase TrpC [Planctomycetota bacterium]
MTDFLDSMVRSSQHRLRRAERREPLESLRSRALELPAPPALRLHASGFDLIAEIKLRSPAAGRLAGRQDEGCDIAARRAILYQQAGAAAVSVLTEPTRFGGHLAHLAAAAWACSIPVMRKDFLLDPYQVYEARAAGAGGVLAIMRILTDEAVRAILAAAAETRLFVLLEAFDESDLERMRRLLEEPSPADPVLLVGLNTRNLDDLSVDCGRLARLAPAFPNGFTRVAESGLSSKADIESVARMGYQVALVGSALMKCDDPASLIRTLLEAGRQPRIRACG